MAEAPPTDDAGIVAWIANGFCVRDWFIAYFDGPEEPVVPNLVISGEEAECIGTRIVEALGAARASELWRGGPWTLLGFGIVNNYPGFLDVLVERPEADTITSIFSECSPEWKKFLIMSVTAGADQISDESADCTSAALPDDVARNILVGELDRAYDDPTQTAAEPFGDLVQPLITAMEGCLTAAELDGLDWN